MQRMAMKLLDSVPSTEDEFRLIALVSIFYLINFYWSDFHAIIVNGIQFNDTECNNCLKIKTLIELEIQISNGNYNIRPSILNCNYVFFCYFVKIIIVIEVCNFSECRVLITFQSI